MCFTQALGFWAQTGVRLHGSKPWPRRFVPLWSWASTSIFCPSFSSSDVIIGHTSQGGCENLNNNIKHFEQCLAYRL